MNPKSVLPLTQGAAHSRPESHELYVRILLFYIIRIRFLHVETTESTKEAGNAQNCVLGTQTKNYQLLDLSKLCLQVFDKHTVEVRNCLKTELIVEESVNSAKSIDLRSKTYTS